MWLISLILGLVSAPPPESLPPGLSPIGIVIPVFQRVIEKYQDTLHVLKQASVSTDLLVIQYYGEYAIQSTTLLQTYEEGLDKLYRASAGGLWSTKEGSSRIKGQILKVCLLLGEILNGSLPRIHEPLEGHLKSVTDEFLAIKQSWTEIFGTSDLTRGKIRSVLGMDSVRTITTEEWDKGLDLLIELGNHIEALVDLSEQNLPSQFDEVFKEAKRLGKDLEETGGTMRFLTHDCFQTYLDMFINLEDKCNKFVMAAKRDRSSESLNAILIELFRTKIRINLYLKELRDFRPAEVPLIPTRKASDELETYPSTEGTMEYEQSKPLVQSGVKVYDPRVSPKKDKEKKPKNRVSASQSAWKPSEAEEKEEEKEELCEELSDQILAHFPLNILAYRDPATTTSTTAPSITMSNTTLTGGIELQSA
jgi:hypothetical protein